jgi:hypothetical protein
MDFPINVITNSIHRFECHVTWVPRHHGMERPQVADGGKASRYGG